MSSNPQPLALMSQCVGNKLWIIMRDSKEIFGMMRGYDNYFNIVLDDATVVETPQAKSQQKKLTKLESMLLNGHQIAFMVPGTWPDYKQ